MTALGFSDNVNGRERGNSQQDVPSDVIATIDEHEPDRQT